MESKRLQEIENYQKKLKELLNNNLLDIIIFGSFVKNGLSREIDLALIIKGEINLLIIKERIHALLKKEVDLQVVDINSIYSPIWLTLIKEGFSVKNNKFLFEIYKIQPCVLYKYSLKKLSKVQKVQFERGIKKILKKNGQFLTRAVILIPITLKNEMIEFLKQWNIYYESKEYELLPILRKEPFV